MNLQSLLLHKHCANNFLSGPTINKNHGWPLHQLDIKNNFLHGDLKKEIYMEKLPRFRAHGEFELVFKLCRYLYGLKQMHLIWI